MHSYSSHACDRALQQVRTRGKRHPSGLCLTDPPASSRRVQLLVGGALLLSFTGMICTWALHTPFTLSCACLFTLSCGVGYSSFPCQQTAQGSNTLTFWYVMPRDPQDTFGCWYYPMLCVAKTMLITIQVLVRSPCTECQHWINATIGFHR